MMRHGSFGGSLRQTRLTGTLALPLALDHCLQPVHCLGPGIAGPVGLLARLEALVVDVDSGLAVAIGSGARR